MLPCQNSCSSFTCGCHKTCQRWKTFQEQQAAQRQVKKVYLQFYNELCSTVSRQFSSMSARRPVW